MRSTNVLLCQTRPMGTSNSHYGMTDDYSRLSRLCVYDRLRVEGTGVHSRFFRSARPYHQRWHVGRGLRPRFISTTHLERDEALIGNIQITHQRLLQPGKDNTTCRHHVIRQASATTPRLPGLIEQRPPLRLKVPTTGTRRKNGSGSEPTCWPKRLVFLMDAPMNSGTRRKQKFVRAKSARVLQLMPDRPKIGKNRQE